MFVVAGALSDMCAGEVFKEINHKRYITCIVITDAANWSSVCSHHDGEQNVCSRGRGPVAELQPIGCCSAVTVMGNIMCVAGVESQ